MSASQEIILGDVRYEHPYRAIATTRDRISTMREMTDEDVIAALSVAAREAEPYLTNVLVTEAQNRARNKAAIIDTASEGMIVVDAEGSVTFANASAERLLGRARNDMLGLHVREVLFGGVADVEGSEFGAVSRAQRVGPTRAKFFRRNGDSFPAAFSSAPILREDRSEGRVIVFDDITPLAQAWDLLAASEARFRRIFESAGSALFVHDLQGRFLDVNHRACSLLGYTREELLKMRASDIEASLAADRLRGFWESIAQDHPVQIGVVARRKDGTLLPLDILLSVFDPGERPLVLAAARELGRPTQ